MSILDKMKGALNAVTGGGVFVRLDHTGTFAAGETLQCKIQCTSQGPELKINGVYVDLQAKGKDVVGQVTGVVHAKQSHSFKVGEGFTLAAKEEKTLEATVTLPAELDANLDWEIRARLDAFGNDPDSGFMDIR